MAKHRIAVTVTDPQATAVTMRNVEIAKYIKVTADDVFQAVAKAKRYYSKRGYKVVDAQFVQTLSA
jgi:hypothetical protein